LFAAFGLFHAAVFIGKRRRLLGKTDLPRVVETKCLWDEANKAVAAAPIDLDESEGIAGEDATPLADEDCGVEQPEGGDREGD
jgi:hypothetical protein